eukprot:7079378-Lingulodinium_polyedra.AAC.1
MTCPGPLTHTFRATSTTAFHVLRACEKRLRTSFGGVDDAPFQGHVAEAHVGDHVSTCFDVNATFRPLRPVLELSYPKAASLNGRGACPNVWNDCSQSC